MIDRIELPPFRIRDLRHSNASTSWSPVSTTAQSLTTPAKRARPSHWRSTATSWQLLRRAASVANDLLPCPENGAAGAGNRRVQSAVGVCKPSPEMDRTERPLSEILYCASPRPYSVRLRRHPATSLQADDAGRAAGGEKAQELQGRGVTAGRLEERKHKSSKGGG
jgi:hypothetical protein